MLSWSTIRPWALTTVIAFIYYWISITIWSVLPRVNPITNWLLDNFSGSGFYYPLITFHDSVVNIAIAVPFALLIRNVAPHRRWILVSFAALVLFLWAFRYVLFDASYYRIILKNPSTVVAIIISSAALPISLVVFERIKTMRSAA